MKLKVKWMGLSLALVSSVLASVPKKVLVEEFTSKDCGYCSVADPIVDSVLALNPDKYSLIRYSVNTDPLKSTDDVTRMNYYPGGYATPGLYINADRDMNNDAGGAAKFTQTMFEHYAKETTDMEISLSASLGSDMKVSINTDLKALEAYGSGLKLHVAVVEELVTLGTSHNKYTHRLMKMSPNGNGTDLVSFTKGETKTFSNFIDMNQTKMETAHDLVAIVFVQNHSTKEVIQSEMVKVSHNFATFDINWTLKESGDKPVEGVLVQIENKGTVHTREKAISDSEGKVVFDNLPTGEYDYTVEKPKYNSIIDVVELIDKDIIETLMMTVPNAFFYEDFDYAQDDYAEIPTGWKSTVASSSDQVYVVQGQVTLYKGGANSDKVILATPELDLSQIDKMILEAGYAMGTQKVKIMTSATPGTSGAELLKDLSMGFAMEEHEIDLSQVNPDHKYIVFVYEGTGRGDNFSITKVVMNKNGQTTTSIDLGQADAKSFSISKNGDEYRVNLKGIQKVEVFNSQGVKVSEALAKNESVLLKDVNHQVVFLRVSTKNQVVSKRVLLK